MMMQEQDVVLYDRDSFDRYRLRSRRVFGRILRGRDGPPHLLASEADRKIAMVMGPAGLGHLSGKSAYEMLVEIGYTRDYIARVKGEGVQFYLLMFRGNLRPKQATWDNVIKVASEVYPSLSRLLLDALPDLRTMTLAKVEQVCGFALSVVDALGSTDPRFMNEERLLLSNQDAYAVRRFLYHCCRLSDLYSGDGLTLTFDGRRGMREYVVPNLELSELGDKALFLLEV